MRDWKPIETAPKDGTAILAYPCGYSSWESNPHSIDVVSWNGVGNKGWYLSLDDGVPSYALGLTHWMPLPNPPQENE